MRRATDCTYSDGRVSAFGISGALIWVDSVRAVTGDRAMAATGYYVDGMYAASFDCSLQRRTGQWHVERCELTMLS